MRKIMLLTLLITPLISGFLYASTDVAPVKADEGEKIAVAEVATAPVKADEGEKIAVAEVATAPVKADEGEKVAVAEVAPAPVKAEEGEKIVVAEVATAPVKADESKKDLIPTLGGEVLTTSDLLDNIAPGEIFNGVDQSQINGNKVFQMLILVDAVNPRAAEIINSQGDVVDLSFLLKSGAREVYSSKIKTAKFDKATKEALRAVLLTKLPSIDTLTQLDLTESDIPQKEKDKAYFMSIIFDTKTGEWSIWSNPKEKNRMQTSATVAKIINDGLAGLENIEKWYEAKQEETGVKDILKKVEEKQKLIEELMPKIDALQSEYDKNPELERMGQLQTEFDQANQDVLKNSQEKKVLEDEVAAKTTAVSAGGSKSARRLAQEELDKANTVLKAFIPKEEAATKKVADLTKRIEELKPQFEAFAKPLNEEKAKVDAMNKEIDDLKSGVKMTYFNSQIRPEYDSKKAEIKAAAKNKLSKVGTQEEIITVDMETLEKSATSVLKN